MSLDPIIQLTFIQHNAQIQQQDDLTNTLKKILRRLEFETLRVKQRSPAALLKECNCFTISSELSPRTTLSRRYLVIYEHVDSMLYSNI